MQAADGAKIGSILPPGVIWNKTTLNTRRKPGQECEWPR
jgi:hypothetical protein